MTNGINMKCLDMLQTAYMSHCPSRWPDYQQLIQLDAIPKPYMDTDAEKAELYQVTYDSVFQAKIFKLGLKTTLVAS